MASTENQNENILQKVEIPEPVLSKPKTLRGSLYMFWKEDSKYGFCSRIPFAIVFVLIVAAVVGLSQLLQLWLEDFMEKQQNVVISDFEQTMSEQCMACCGMSGSSEFVASDCPVPSCFSDAYMSIMEPSPCQSLYLI